MTALAPRHAAFPFMVALAVLMTGCLSRAYPVKQRYVLATQRAVESPSTGGAGVLRVGRMRVSSLFERKSFVYRTGDTTFEDDFYNEFFAPPAILLQQATLLWLKDARLFSTVIDASERGAADWLLEGRTAKLFGDLRNHAAPRVVMEIEFALTDQRAPERNVVFKKEYSTETAAGAASAQALAAAWQESLARILTDLEEDLRARLSPAR